MWDLVEVVVAVPFEPVAGHAHLAVQGVDQLGDAPRQFGAGIAQPEAHRVAQADFDRQLGRNLFAHAHQPSDERQHEAADIGFA